MRTTIIFILLLILAVALHAQTDSIIVPGRIGMGATLPAACNSQGPTSQKVFFLNSGLMGLYQCINNAWVRVGSGAVGPPGPQGPVGPKGPQGIPGVTVKSCGAMALCAPAVVPSPLVVYGSTPLSADGTIFTITGLPFSSATSYVIVASQSAFIVNSSGTVAVGVPVPGAKMVNYIGVGF